MKPNALFALNFSSVLSPFSLYPKALTGKHGQTQSGHDMGDADLGFKAWDPSNAREILQWTIAQRRDHLLFGLELGNEQNKVRAERNAAKGHTLAAFP